jgi:hypothetical protein
VTATAVESAATAAVEPADRAAMHRATADVTARITESAAVSVDSYASAAIVAAASVITATAVIAAPAVVAVASAVSVVSSAIVAAAEPGTSADEDAANEPIRTVVAIRSAGVRSIAVVTISTGRRCVPVTISGVRRTAYSNTNRNPLRIRITSAEQANRQEQSRHTSKPEVSHDRTPFRVLATSV